MSGLAVTSAISLPRLGEQGWGTAIIVTSHFLSNVTMQRHKRSSFPQLPSWGNAAEHSPWCIPCACTPQSVSPFPTLSRIWVVIAALNKHWVSSNLQQSRAGKEAAKKWLLLGCRTSQLHLSQSAKLLLKLRHTWCTRQAVGDDNGDKVTHPWHTPRLFHPQAALRYGCFQPWPWQELLGMPFQACRVKQQFPHLLIQQPKRSKNLESMHNFSFMPWCHKMKLLAARSHRNSQVCHATSSHSHRAWQGSQKRKQHLLFRSVCIYEFLSSLYTQKVTSGFIGSGIGNATAFDFWQQVTPLILTAETFTVLLRA